MIVLGLDLTASEARPSAAVALRFVGAQHAAPLRIAFWGQIGSDADILGEVESLKPDIVAIDAPLSLLPGLHCLEDTCPCSPLRPFRSAERELHRLGFGLFYTTKKSTIKGMVYRGLRLHAALSRGAMSRFIGMPPTVLEVYPYATKVRLWGRPIPRKTTQQGLAFLRERLAALLPSTVPYLPRLTHDMADAVLAAYTGYLYIRGQAELVGNPDEGQICIPLGMEAESSSMGENEGEGERLRMLR